VRFAWPEVGDNDDEKEMQVIQESDLKVNETTYINDTIGLHRMENRHHAMPGVTLHLYVPPYESCRSFDQRTGHTNEVKVTFYSKNGKRVPVGGKGQPNIISYENN